MKDSATIRIACDVKDYLPLEDFIAFQGNLKSLSTKRYEELKQEIVSTGFAFPPYVWKGPKGERFILGGHQRIRTLQQMKTEGFHVPLVPIVYVFADNLKQAKRRVLQDVAQYGQVERQGLYEFMVDAEISMGDLAGSFAIPDASLDMNRFQAEFFDKNPGGMDGEDDIPAVPEEAKSKLGELYALGEHRLLCGDSTDPEVIGRLMGEERAHLIFTDPPWNVNYGADMEQGNAQGYKPRTIMNDHMNPAQWKEFVDGITRSLYTASKPGCPIYLVMSAQEWPVIDLSLREAGFHWSSTVIWAKDRLVLSRKDYHTQYEPIWYGWNGEGPRLSPVLDRKQSDLWQIQRPSRSDLHPTTKPVELVERAIMNSSKRGNVVLDLFGGSGSTLIASEKTGRRCFMTELDPRYVDVICKRFEELTGQKAKLVTPPTITRKRTS